MNRLIRCFITYHLCYSSYIHAQELELGSWGPIIKLPIIPMAGTVIPQSNQLLLWAAARNNLFTHENSAEDYTLFTTIDLSTMEVAEQNISNTSHDMFCPGISLTGDGQVVVSGGSTATTVSTYDPSIGQWARTEEMNVPRGYQSTVLTSEGRIFTIGGSWSGGIGAKLGEIYDPNQQIWNTLPGCDVNAILTDDIAGIYRSDNHANLFTWKNASIFHSGPSKTMHWFDTRGFGRTISAGLRLDATDGMCGSAVMYDAGKILTAGGAANYENTQGTDHAYVTTIEDAYDTVSTEEVSRLNIPRTLANAVVLPDGQVLLTGGQRFSYLFTDITAVLTPELYNPATKSWRLLSNDSTPRTYHSISILLPDATVFSGGGGGCGECEWNHLDGAIFKPPYLFKDGSLATRPVILSISKETVALGSDISVLVDGSGLTFAFVRVGSVTHTVNTDQRRLSVTPSRSDGNSYILPVPADPGVAPVGYWFLFALSADGVPSVAKTVRFTSDAPVSALQLNFPDINRPCAGATSADSTYMTTNGEIYAICQNSDLNDHKDFYETLGVPGIQDCSAICSETAGCTMTSYVPEYRACYLKYSYLSTSATALNVTASIKISARPCANYTAVSSITTMADGRIFGICANTDFKNGDKYIEYGLSSVVDCADRCHTHSDCISASWWSNTCYMKTTLRPALLNEAVQSVFKMQKSACLDHAAPSSIYNTSNADIYGHCAGQDFHDAEIAVYDGVSDIQSCVQLCADTTDCVAAAFNPVEQTCGTRWTTTSPVIWTGGDVIFRIGIAS